MSTTRPEPSKKRKARSRFTDEYGLLLRRLIEVRKAAGVTQEQMARHLGKVQSHVSLIEAREREISVIDLWKWCHVSGITMKEFVGMFEEDVQQLWQTKRPSPKNRATTDRVQL